MPSQILRQVKYFESRLSEKKSHKKHQMNQPAGSKNRYDRIELLFLTANKVDNRYKE